MPEMAGTADRDTGRLNPANATARRTRIKLRRRAAVRRT